MVRRGDCGRRDWMLWLATLAEALLTLLGAASERTGLGKRLNAGTAKKRVQSLFTQGQRWYHFGGRCERRRCGPYDAFGDILIEHQVNRRMFTVLFGENEGMGKLFDSNRDVQVSQ